MNRPDVFSLKVLLRDGFYSTENDGFTVVSRTESYVNCLEGNYQLIVEYLLILFSWDSS